MKEQEHMASRKSVFETLLVCKKPKHLLLLALPLILFNYLGIAQNKKTQTLALNDLTTVIVNGDQIFNIRINTWEMNNIEITSNIEGEYQENFQILSNVKDQELNIELLQNPYLNIADNKLSAHKVIVATLEVNLPKHLNLGIKSDVGSVVINGIYNNLSVDLDQGSCLIKGLAQKAVIHAIKGGIEVHTQNPKITPTSNQGEKHIDKNLRGTDVWQLSSIYGNISVLKQ